jgi:hypothetical protein
MQARRDVDDVAKAPSPVIPAKAGIQRYCKPKLPAIALNTAELMLDTGIKLQLKLIMERIWVIGSSTGQCT